MTIRIENLSKTYKTIFGMKTVLRDVNIEIQKGEKIGLLGRNGSGKTTLLKIIGGIEIPSTGSITADMSISWPIGFAGGFQGSMSALDNARFIARIYDVSFEEMMGFVEGFAELGPYLRMPIKTYSSGMRARLAFGLSIAIEFDCYLIDEVMSVGDHRFRNKSRSELFEKRKDRALIIASHDPAIIKGYCNRCLILDKGKATLCENVSEALEIYSTL
jgi:capsular polysaccharide transport system ATP-binding protein